VVTFSLRVIGFPKSPQPLDDLDAGMRAKEKREICGKAASLGVPLFCD
jgi:hypothetical protein